MAVASTIAQANYKKLVGVVVDAGARLKTIRVRIPKQDWHPKVKKYYDNPYQLLVNDPNQSCRVGDIVRIRSGWRASKHIKHIVTDIVTPFGEPLAQRPPLPTEAERVAARTLARRNKVERQAARGRAAALEKLTEYRAADRDVAQRTKHAERSLAAGTHELLAAARTQLTAENDLVLIQRRVQDVINLQLRPEHSWALAPALVRTLSVAVAARHAAQKQLSIGVDLPLLAGHDPTSVLVEYERGVASAFDAIYDTAVARFHELAREEAHIKYQTDVVEALEKLQGRLTSSWLKVVHANPKAENVRDERRKVATGTVTAEQRDTAQKYWARQVDAVFAPIHAVQETVQMVEPEEVEAKEADGLAEELGEVTLEDAEASVLEASEEVEASEVQETSEVQEPEPKV